MQHLLMRWLLFLLPFSRSGAQHSERVSHLLKVLCREAEPGFHPRSLNPKRAVGLKRRNTAHEKSSPHRSPRDPGLERGHRGGGRFTGPLFRGHLRDGRPPGVHFQDN